MDYSQTFRQMLHYLAAGDSKQARAALTDPPRRSAREGKKVRRHKRVRRQMANLSRRMNRE